MCVKKTKSGKTQKLVLKQVSRGLQGLVAPRPGTKQMEACPVILLCFFKWRLTYRTLNFLKKII